MYYLSKLCRICIQTKQSLVNLDTVDYDSISLNEKLEICTKMVIKSQKEVSKEICSSCVHKLRISYEFYNMCKKSTGILNGYVSKLLNITTPTGNSEAFANTDLFITLTKTPITQRKKRVGKSERCAAMQKLMSDKNQQDYFNCTNELCLMQARSDKPRGGLKDLLSFTKSFDFGYNLNSVQEIGDNSPLDKLIEFSESFFYADFDEYRRSILGVIENNDSDSEADLDESEDIEDMFKSFEEGESDEEKTKFEGAIANNNEIKQELLNETESDESTDPTNYLQICYKSEKSDVTDEEKCQSSISDNNNEDSSVVKCKPILSRIENNCIEEWSSGCSSPTHNYIFNTGLQKSVAKERSQPDLVLLSKLTESVNLADNLMIPSDISPKRNKLVAKAYISPKLQKQYLYCNFKCDSCNRNFKSHGYLKAHNSKVHHSYK